MKKKIFNWLFVLVILPCMLFVNGCGKDDDKDPGDEKMEVVTDYVGVNEVLASLSQKKGTLKQFKIDGVYKTTDIDLESEQKKSYEGLDWEKRNIKASIDFENEEFSIKYYNDDGTWYNTNYVQNEDNQYVGYNKTHYVSGEERFYSYLISKDSIINEMIFVNQIGVDLNRLNYSDYDSLKNSYNLLVKEDISRYWSLKDFNIVINPVSNLYKQNNGYIFEYKLTITIDGVVITIDSVVKFNEEAITDYKYFHSYETQYWYDAEEVVLKYSSGVDTSLYLTDFSGFVDEPLNDSFRVTVVVDGYVVNSSVSGTLVSGNLQYTPGEKYTYNYSVGEGITFDGWYLDPEYTIKLDTLTDCPSYNLIIYGKVSATDPNDTIIVSTAFVEQRYSDDFHVKFECVEKGSEYLFDFSTHNNKKSYNFKSGVQFYFNEMTVDGVSYTVDSFVVGNADKHYISIKGEAFNKY